MAGKCDICGKVGTFGHNVSHSKRRTNRRFYANIQTARVMVNGVAQQKHVCTRCLRNIHKF